MIQSAVTPHEGSVEAVLRSDLAQGDAVLQSAGPIMRHLLSGAQHPIFADETVARVRGAVTNVARQLLDAVVAAAGPGDRAERDPEALDRLVEALIAIPGFLGHLHALALEWRLIERLRAGQALDPVVPPLLEALLASDDATTSALAMKLLAAQARFVQWQRRMQVPLGELPADLLHGALLALRTLGGNDAQVVAAEKSLRAGYDESRTRLGLIARLLTGMGNGAVAALALHHAGVAIFASALGIASGQDRDVVVVSTSEGQGTRLGLALRAAGLKQGAIEEQLLAVHAEVARPVAWDRLAVEDAGDMLAAALPHVGA
ncbi:MAG: hypothetical protein QM676_06280 [Novosphingobium sp.]